MCVPLFKIDDKLVKRVIKDSVGAKEGDFNGQSMMCGTTVNPVVVINGRSLKYVDRSTAFSINEVWYPLGDDKSIKRIQSIQMKQTNNETDGKEIVVYCDTLSGQTLSATFSFANNTVLSVMLALGQGSETLYGTSDGALFNTYEGGYAGNVRIKFNAAAGTAQTFIFRMWYYE